MTQGSCPASVIGLATMLFVAARCSLTESTATCKCKYAWKRPQANAQPRYQCEDWRVPGIYNTLSSIIPRLLRPKPRLQSQLLKLRKPLHTPLSANLSHPSTHPQRFHKSTHRRPKPTSRIPSHRRLPARRITPLRTPNRHIRKRLPPLPIKPRIQKPQHRSPLRQQRIINQRHHGRHLWCRGASTIDMIMRLVPHSCDSVPLCCNIRVTAALRVV